MSDQESGAHAIRDRALADLARSMGREADIGDPRVREEVESVFAAWFACLVAPGLGTVRMDRLDDAMLPAGTTDRDLECGGCPLNSGASIRRILAGLKASLPPGSRLPEAMVAYLAACGARVL